MTMAQETVNVRPTYGYYRQPDGWITVSPATDTDELKYRRDGWTPLKQYGYIEMATAYAANNPLEGLFMRGGAGELCEDQIRKQGLYLNPPLVPSCRTPLDQNHRRHTRACLSNAKPVVFPQLAGMTDLGPFPCAICDRVLPTIAARDQHTTVMHAPEKSDERTGQSLSDALIKGLAGKTVVEPASNGGNGVDTLEELQELRRELAATVQEMQALKAGQASAPGPDNGALARPVHVRECSVCKQRFESINLTVLQRKLREHRKKVHTAAGVMA